MFHNGWYSGLRWLLIALLASATIFVACGPGSTVCKNDFDCKNGFYCGETDTGQKFCIKRTNNQNNQNNQSNQTNQNNQTNQSNQNSQNNQSNQNNQTNQNNQNSQNNQSNQSNQNNQTNQNNQSNQNNQTNQNNNTNTNPGSCTIPPYNEANVKPNGGQQVAMDNLDKAFFKEMYRIYYVSQNCNNKVWGGKFEMHTLPTFIVNVGSAKPGTRSGKKGFLINAKNPPAGAKLIDSKLVYGIPNVYSFDSVANQVQEPGFDFGFKVGNNEVYAFEYSSGDDFTNPTYKNPSVGKAMDVFAFFIHEAFHRIQDYEESWNYPPGDQNPDGYPLTEELTGLAILLGSALIDGITGKIPAEQALKMYYAIRKERIDKDTSSRKLIKNLDTFQEWLEGTAMYAEYQYTVVLGFPYPNSDPNSVVGRINYFASGIQGSDTRSDVIDVLAARYYATGAAVGLLLDKAGDQNWKEQIRQGKTFYDVVAAKYKLSNSQASQLVQQAKQQYNYASKILPTAKSYAAKK